MFPLKKFSRQLIAFLLAIFLGFQTIIYFNMVDNDISQVVHNHFVKINTILILILVIIDNYIIHRVNALFIHPLIKIKKEKQLVIRQKNVVSSILNKSHDAIIILNKTGIITKINPCCCQLLGYDYLDIINTPIMNLIDQNAYRMIKTSLSHELNQTHQWQGEFNIKNQKTKKDTPIYIKINKIIDERNNDIQYTIVATNLTTIKEIDKLIYLNNHDALTNLPNRTALFNHLNNTLENQLSTNEVFAVLFIDLDNFKAINDNYGHNTGDLVLKIIATKLRNSMKKTDMIGRLAGDEFIAIIQPITEQQHTMQTCNRILNILQQSLTIEQHHIDISASIGCYYSKPNSNLSVDNILHQADSAMYKAKKEGKGQIVEYNTL